VVRGSALAVLFCAISLAQPDRLYIGTYTNTDAHSHGIYSTVFDPETGKLGEMTPAAETVNPSFVARHPSRPILYAVNEEQQGSVSSFAIDSTGELKFLGKSSTGGADPCHLIVDRTGKWLLVANYSGGNIAVMPIRPDGEAGEARVIPFSGSGPNPRQKASHPHEILELAGSLILVSDLGADRIVRYRLHPENGTLAPADPPEIRLPPGSGPRHMAVTPDGGRLYVLSELANTVTVFVRGSIIQTVSLLESQSEARNTAAEIAIHPGGRYVYASVRGADNIVVFAIDPGTGTLRRLGVSSTGAEPRFFTIDRSGKWLLAAGQASNTITVFALDPATGRLRPQPDSPTVPAPVFIGADRHP